ncbi:MAG: Lrp/AsnC ligand binding domain-containing protein [Nitrosopumilaceae archaeon]
MSKAYVLISCEPGSDDYVVSNLKAISSVKSAYGTFGLYDVIAKIEASTEADLKNDLMKRIRKLDKIQGTITLMAEERTDILAENFAKNQDLIKDKKMAEAYIIIHTEKGIQYQILRSLSKIPGVVDGDLVVGYYEVICKVAAPTYNDIGDVVTKKIRKLADISSTITLNIIPSK